MLDIDLLLWLNHFSQYFFQYFFSSFWGTISHQDPPTILVSAPWYHRLPLWAPAIATALQSMQQGDMDAVG